jgi:hypothetical protein
MTDTLIESSKILTEINKILLDHGLNTSYQYDDIEIAKLFLATISQPNIKSITENRIGQIVISLYDEDDETEL